jgi:hypothetical protein
MLSGMVKTCAVVMLLIYGAYTLSPMYAVLTGPADESGAAEASSCFVKVGFLWADLVFDSLTGGSRPGERSRGEQLLHEPQEDDMVLIKKKRAVNQRTFLVRQPLQTCVIAATESVLPAPAPFSYDIPLDLIHGHADGYHSISTGLSPPPVPS